MCQYIEVNTYMHMYMSDDNADLCTDIISAASGSVILLKRVKPKLSTYRKKYHLSSISESKLLLYFYHMSWSSVKAYLFFTLIHIHTHAHTYTHIHMHMHMHVHVCANLHTKTQTFNSSTSRSTFSFSSTRTV